MKAKADFELGQLAFTTGKHHDDCSFKLPHRRAAWQRGYRDAKYNDPFNNSVSKISTIHISNLRKLLRNGGEVCSALT